MIGKRGFGLLVTAILVTGIVLGGMGSVSAGDFTCSQLVELGIISASSISHGTLILPVGFIQVDGTLFQMSVVQETGTFYGEAYNLTSPVKTGLIVGNGY